MVQTPKIATTSKQSIHHGFAYSNLSTYKPSEVTLTFFLKNSGNISHQGFILWWYGSNWIMCFFIYALLKLCSVVTKSLLTCSTHKNTLEKGTVCGYVDEENSLAGLNKESKSGMSHGFMDGQVYNAGRE